jgi:cobalt-zinc-cadmium efflux system outer membrane protein
MESKVFGIICVVMLTSMSSIAISQQPADINDLHILPDYLRLASLNNAQLRARFEEWKAALEQVPQAKALDDPKFTYSYFIEEVETRIGPQRQKFGVMQYSPGSAKLRRGPTSRPPKPMPRNKGMKQAS